MSMGVLPVYKTHKRKMFFDLKLYCSKYICIYFEITVIKTWKLFGHTNSDFCLNLYNVYQPKFWISSSKWLTSNLLWLFSCKVPMKCLYYNQRLYEVMTLRKYPISKDRLRRCVHACTTLFLIDQTNKNLNTLSTQT